MRWLPVLVVALLAVSTAQAQENRIAAVVNNDIITLDDLQARIAMVMSSSGIPNTPENRQRLQPRMLDQLVDEKLETQEARRLNIKVDPKEVQDALHNIEQRNNMPKDGLEEYLKRAGIPKSTLTDQISASLVWTRVVRNMLSNEVNISNEEVNESLAQIKQEAGKPQSHVAEIFLAIDNPSQEDDVQRLAERLIQQIRGGANFSAVAQQFSQAPSSAAGGDIGWLTPSQLAAPLSDALEKMKPGEMSYPQRTPGGIYILYVIERRTLGSPNPDDTQLSLVQVIYPLPAGATAADRSRIMNDMQRLSDQSKSCGELTKLGKDHIPPLVTQAGDVKAGAIPADTRSQVLALKIAQASKPIALSTAPGIAVFMVCQRQDPPGGMPTSEEVQENLARQRLDALARRYLRNLRRSAFLDIRA